MPEQTWWLPGFAVEALIGFGATGEVWRARESATGDVVALKRLRRRGSGPADAERLRREAALLAEVAGPHLLRLRGVVVTDTDTVLVLDHAAGGSLAGLLAVRRALDPGEVVTVLAPLASALADLHARGLVHGDLSPGNVLFTADGRPLLADLGVARLVGEPAAGPAEGTAGYVDPAVARGSVPDRAADVHALAAIGYAALAGRPPWDAPTADGAAALAAAGKRLPLGEVAPGAPARLVEAVEAALAAEPSARPGAAAFAAALRQAAAPAPVRLVRGAGRPDVASTERVGGGVHAAVPPPEPDRVRGGMRLPRVRRSTVVVAGTAVALTLAAAVGSAWGRAEHPRVARLDAAAAPVVAPAQPAWAEVVQRLVAARAAAVTVLDAGALARVYAPRSVALADDTATVRGLAGAHARVRGALRQQVRTVSVVSVTAGRVRLRMVDSLAAYDVVDGSGRVLRHDPGRAAASWDVVLVAAGPAADPWRIGSITRTA